MRSRLLFDLVVNLLILAIMFWNISYMLALRNYSKQLSRLSKLVEARIITPENGMNLMLMFANPKDHKKFKAELDNHE